VPYGELNIPAPMAYAMERIRRAVVDSRLDRPRRGLGIGSVILVMLLGQSRVFYSMSRDGLIGRWGGQVHPRFRTPYLSTIYTGIAVCSRPGSYRYNCSGPGSTSVRCSRSSWCARRVDLCDIPTGSRATVSPPLVPLVPLLGIVSCVGLMLTLPLDTWIRLLVWLVIGFGIYFGYSRKHSALRARRSPWRR